MRLMGFFLVTFLALSCEWSRADVGMSMIEATGTGGSVTLFYPTQRAASLIRRGSFALQLAEQAEPQRGNGRLIVISHGSGGGPWVHADLARSLVEVGFVVAMPQHHADNNKDPSNPGPDSWAIRPKEVSRAIDLVGRDARLGPLLSLERVGVYGMSAGGHTALSMAGGRWSAARFKEHCEANLTADFHACVGLITRLRGNIFDNVKKWVALAVIRHRFSDATVLSHHDPRIAAVVAGVPAAADFDPTSLATPSVPLGLVTAGRDLWLTPRFHSGRVLQVCITCEHIADLTGAGHGALLSPLPPGLSGLEGELLNDPPGFDRSQMRTVNQKITAFFVRHLSD